MTARWLTPKERAVAVDRVSENMIGIKDSSFRPYQVREALVDHRLWILCLMGVANGIVSGGIGNFGSALIKGYGFSGVDATLLQLPTVLRGHLPWRTRQAGGPLHHTSLQSCRRIFQYNKS
jgi:hypothetical protein